MITYAHRAAGDQTAPSLVTVRTGDPVRRRMGLASARQDIEDSCAREVRLTISAVGEALPERSKAKEEEREARKRPVIMRGRALIPVCSCLMYPFAH